MMMTVYDPSGKAHTIEAVDAREYLKSGHYTSEAPEVSGANDAAGVTELPASAVDAAGDTIEAVDAVNEPAADKPGRPGRKSKTV
jgi:hypothetical protein